MREHSAATRRRRKHAPLSVIMLTALSLASCAANVEQYSEPVDQHAEPSEQNAEPTVVLYGDSLAQEAADSLGAQLGDAASFETVVLPGVALCDALDPIRADTREGTATYALIQFSGNNITPCVRQSDGRPLEGDELAAKYRADAETAVRSLRQHGVEVYLVGSPVADETSGVQAVNRAFGQVAREWERRGGGVHYVDAGRAVSPDDTYTRTLPCLEFETPAHGCEAGRIPVRSPEGGHFCPVANEGLAKCPVWSSGAHRFASAMAEPVLMQIRDR